MCACIHMTFMLLSPSLPLHCVEPTACPRPVARLPPHSCPSPPYSSLGLTSHLYSPCSLRSRHPFHRPSTTLTASFTLRLSPFRTSQSLVISCLLHSLLFKITSLHCASLLFPPLHIPASLVIPALLVPRRALHSSTTLHISLRSSSTVTTTREHHEHQRAHNQATPHDRPALQGHRLRDQEAVP